MNPEHVDDVWTEADSTDSQPPSLKAPVIAPTFSKFPDEERREAKARARVEQGDREHRMWLPMLAIMLVVLVLVIAALFLPPLSLWDSISGDDDDEQTSTTQNGVAGAAHLAFGADALHGESNGLAIDVSAEDPGTGFGVYVVAVGPDSYLAGETPATGWNCTAAALPELPGPIDGQVYSLTQSGTAPTSLLLQVASTEDSSLYVWDAANNAWTFLPGQYEHRATVRYVPRCVALFRPVESARQVNVVLSPGDTFNPAVLEANARVYLAGARPLYPNTDPSSQYLTALYVPPIIKTEGAADVMPMMQNFENPAVIDVATVTQILENPALRSDHAQQVAAYALNNNYAGVALDYRGVPTELRAAYAAFLGELAGLMHQWGGVLTVVLPAPKFDMSTQTWQTEGYDWIAVGQAADQVIVNVAGSQNSAQDLMQWAIGQIERRKLVLGLSAYSLADQGDGSTAPTPLSDMADLLGVVQLDPAGEVVAGQTISAQLVNPYGLRPELAGSTLSLLNDQNAVLLSFRITDATTLHEQIGVAEAFNLSGVLIYDLMAAQVMPGLENVLVDYRVRADTTAETLAMTWVVRDGETVITTEALAPRETFTMTVPEGHAALTVEAHLGGVMFSSAAIVVGEAPAVTETATEAAPTAATEEAAAPAVTEEMVPLGGQAATPAPTATAAAETTETTETTETETTETAPAATEEAGMVPLGQNAAGPTQAQNANTPEAQLTVIPVTASTAVPTVLYVPPSTEAVPAATAEVIAQAATPSPTVAAAMDPAAVAAVLALTAPAVDPAGVDLGTAFEIGGHSTDFTGTSIRTMGKTHFKWVRFQIDYRLGMVPDDLKDRIGIAQGNGFKVLLSVVGDPAEMISDPVGYYQQYVAYVGGLAALKVDAVEVWHEMNDPAAWPVELGSAGYNKLLELAYSAIKTANPGTMVISGALQQAMPPAEGDLAAPRADDVFYDEMAAASAYRDCVGVQYLLGAVAPDATSGDPRGDAPIYYLNTSLDRAYDPLQKPLCLTRFGYLTPEGYGVILPEGYAWAQNTTLAQQGQWLAAAQQRLATGSVVPVRLMIVWSVDVPAFEQPVEEAGYSIIRPDTTCPACDVLEPLLKPAS